MSSSPTVIVAARALVGRNLHMLHDARVVLEGESITAIGDSSSIGIPEGARVVDASGLMLIPGFIDAHVHIALADPNAIAAGGVTTVRDLGWIPEEIWPLVAGSRSPRWDGPGVVAAGQMLTVAGGYPTRAACAPAGVGRAVGGGEAVAAVAEQAERGATIIKVALNAAAGPTLSRSLLKEIVSAAHGEGLRVTAHVTGLDELRKATGAGVDELAHMLMSEERISDEQIGAMVAAQMTVVPTLSIRFGRDLETAIDNLKRFIAAGGRIVYGTDLGNFGPEPGIDARELDGLERAGLSAREIIASATVDSASYLGLDRIGALAPRMQADIVAVPNSAMTTPDALSDVKMVWRAGRRIR